MIAIDGIQLCPIHLGAPVYFEDDSVRVFGWITEINHRGVIIRTDKVGQKRFFRKFDDVHFSVDNATEKQLELVA